MKLSVHIGLHKTGTTSVQKTYERNRDRLLHHGVLYPQAASIAAGGHLNLVWELTSPWKHVKGVGGAKELIDEVKAASPDHVIISAESLSGFRRRDDVLALPAKLGEELGADVHIVATVRPQFLLLDSLYAQNASTGYTSDSYGTWIMDQLAEGNVDLEALLGRWFEAYDDVSLLVVEKGGGSSLAEELLGVCGIEVPPGFTAAPRANVRTTARAVEYGRLATDILGASGFPPGVRHAIIRELKRSVIENYPDESGFGGMSQEIASFVHEFFSPRNDSFFAQRQATLGFRTSPSDYPFSVNQMNLDTGGADTRRDFEVLLTKAVAKVLDASG